MPELLKNVSFGQLLRSVFAGVFFVISYGIATGGSDQLQIIGKIDSGMILLASLFAGVTAYGIHRSLVYPLLEWIAFDSDLGKTCRQRVPLIRKFTLDSLMVRWNRGIKDCEVDRRIERSRQMTVWADYAHLQYASSLSIVLGRVAAHITHHQSHVAPWSLFGLAILFFLAGFVSDWRLRSVENVSAVLNSQPTAQ